MRWNVVFLIGICSCVVWTCISATQTVVKQPDKICKSIEITTVKDFELLRDCKVVVGFVHIAHLHLTQKTLIPESSVEDITDYLLVYQVDGLTTLQRIFPHLKLIRGKELFAEKYSLVVYENRDLENLGLVSLLRIQNGAVRIEHNPVLCFVDTVNWVYLFNNSIIQHFFFKNKPSHECPLCSNALAVGDESKFLQHHCWSLEAHQRNITFGSKTNCSEKCGVFGCDPEGDCCSRQCLTGCLNHDCELCATYSDRGICVDTCDFTNFEINKRECITEAVCRRKGLIRHDGFCVETCPEPYQEFKDALNNRKCNVSCSGSFEIRTREDLVDLKECTFIDGSLTIELEDVKEKIVEELENALKKIKEINGYLKIHNSPQLVSLQFLSELHTINGTELIDNKYAFYVVNNVHLEQIWNQNQNVAILNGRLYFHLNPRLCAEKILSLQPSLRSVQRISTTDVSRNSNGERVICGENVRVLNATVEDFNSTAVRIKVNPVTADELAVLLGYVHYYMETPMRNVTHYDGRHGCGHDNWQMDISPTRNVRHIICDLKPYTQYAYFVKTLTMTDYHTQVEAYSKIQYFRTLPSKPGPVFQIYYYAVSTTELMIHWWPPKSPNGVIAYYLISYAAVEGKNSADEKEKSLQKPPTKPLKCECNIRDAFYSGPAPDDENYYSKAQVMYDDLLPNYVYVSNDKKGPVRAPKNKNSTNTTQAKSPTGTSTNTTQAKSPSDTSSKTTQTESPPGTSSKTTQTEFPSITLTEETASDAETVSIGLIEYSDFDQHPNGTNKTSTESKDDVTNKTTAFREYREALEKKALSEQDTGISDFQITKPKPICSGNDTTAQYQVEKHCRVIDKYDGVKVPGHIHQYSLSNVIAEKSYEISVRACLNTGECGAAKKIYAKTISKILDNFLHDTTSVPVDNAV